MQAPQTVRGVYHDERRASKAVEELIDAHVPVEEIHVIVRNAEGDDHEVQLEYHTAIQRVGIVGGAVGAVVGGVCATLVDIGVLPVSLPFLASAPALATLEGVVLGAGAGGILGALAGLGRWTDEADLHDEDLEHGAALIAVQNPSLQDVARRIFEETGADQIDELPSPA